jgi:hypothetical protein
MRRLRKLDPDHRNVNQISQPPADTLDILSSAFYLHCELIRAIYV